MTLITIRETAPFDKSPNATVSFDRQGEFSVTISDPFSEQEEKQLEWYFEEHLKFPFAKQVEAKQAGESIVRYGEALFAQIFKSDFDVYAQYKQARQEGIDRLNFEIIGSPDFHRLHWEAVKDPELPTPFVIDAPMVRTTFKSPTFTLQVKESPTINLLIVTARPGGINDVGYRTISRPLVDGLRKTRVPVQMDILRPGTYEAFIKHLDAVREQHGVGYYHIIHFDMHGALMSYEQTRQVCESDYYQFRRYARADIQAYEGKKAFLAFEGEEEGKPDLAEAAELADLLIKHHVPVVVLNACQSGKQIGDTETSLGSRLLQAGIQTVLAMGYSVTVSAASLMMQTLYQKLFDKNNLSLGVREARFALHADKERRAYYNQNIHLEDWLLPVVYASKTMTALPLRKMSFEEEAFFLHQEHLRYKAPEPAYGFVGRDLDILQIEKRLLSVSEGKKRNLLMIRGMGGAGKTTLLCHVMEWWQKTRFVSEVFYFGYDEKAWTLQQILDSIAEKLFSKDPLPPGMSISPALTQFRSMAVAVQQEMIARRLRSERHLLVLDNLESVTGEYLSIKNTLSEAERAAVRNFLADLLDGETFVLLGTRGGEDWLVSGQNPPLRKNDVYDLPGLDPESASMLADRVLERHVGDRKILSEYRQSPDFQRLLKLLNGYPLPMEVVLANLSRQTPLQVLESLQAGDVNLDAKDAQTKTESILKCIEYSHSALSEDAQKLMLCFAPFTGVINTNVLPQYAEQLKQQPALKDLPFDKFEDVLNECISRGLVKDHELPGFVRLQPIFPYFLRSRLNTESEDMKKAVETSFREHYNFIGGLLAQLLHSKEPQQKRQTFSRLEYENLMMALNIALKNQVSIIRLYGPLSKYLDTTQEHQRGLRLGQTVLESLENYPLETLVGQVSTDFFVVIDDIAKRFLLLKQYEQAEKTYQKALDICSENSTDLMKKMSAGIYHQLGIVAHEQHKWSQAESYYHNALKIDIEFNNICQQALIYHQLGALAQDQCKWAQAEYYFHNALKIFIKFNERSSQAKTYHHLGIVAHGQRKWSQAESYYHNALKINIEFNDRHSQAATYLCLGAFARDQRKWNQAEAYFHNALKIYIEFKDQYSQAKTYHQLGMIAQEQRKWEQSEAYFHNALKIYIKFNDRYEQAGTYHQLGRVAQKQRKWEQAEAYFHNALKIVIKSNDRCYQALLYKHLGILAKEQKQWKQSGEYYLKALEIFIEHGDKLNLEFTLCNLSRLYSESNDTTLPPAVASVLNVTTEEAEKRLKEPSSVSVPSELWQFLENVFRIRT